MADMELGTDCDCDFVVQNVSFDYYADCIVEFGDYAVVY